MVAQAVLHLISIIGMTWPRPVAQEVVAARVCIPVPDQQGYGGAGGLSLEDAGEDLHLIHLLSLGGCPALARTPAVQLLLNIIFR
jgi:hypothetical protein